MRFFMVQRVETVRVGIVPGSIRRIEDPQSRGEFLAVAEGRRYAKNDLQAKARGEVVSAPINGRIAVALIGGGNPERNVERGSRRPPGRIADYIFG
jgi:hypothetical protein